MYQKLDGGMLFVKSSESRHMTATAANANRYFSAILRRVTRGQSVTITAHGRPVARLIPVDRADETADAARGLLFARLRAARISKGVRWTRDDLYDRGR